MSKLLTVCQNYLLFVKITYCLSESFAVCMLNYCLHGNLLLASLTGHRKYAIICCCFFVIHIDYYLFFFSHICVLVAQLHSLEIFNWTWDLNLIFVKAPNYSKSQSLVAYNYILKFDIISIWDVPEFRNFV